MTVGIETIKRLEKMTKLQLDETDRDIASEYLTNLTNRFEQMESIPTCETEPLISVANLKNIMREDISFQMITREELFKNAVEENNGYFQVPKTID